MRTICLLLTSLIASAQSLTTTYQNDVNGRREAVYSTDRSGKGASTDRAQSVDGGSVPVEGASERVIRDDASGKVVERTVKRYDPNGRVTGTDKIVTEETKLADGGKLVKETRSRSDINGGFKEFERKTSETHVSGPTSTTNVTIDRPAVNGGFATAEKRNIVTSGPADRQSSTETVEQANGNGGFRQVRRTESSVEKSGGTSKENSSEYELDPTGRLALTAQKVATTTKVPGGGEKVETTLYSKNVAGEVQGVNGRMRVKEQQVLERSAPGADGQVHESLSVARPSMADPEKLGPLQQVAERVCTGKCSEPPAAPTKAATAKGK
jgi:hypothetical protein